MTPDGHSDELETSWSGLVTIGSNERRDPRIDATSVLAELDVRIARLGDLDAFGLAERRRELVL
jgi:hypothetical protein